METSVFSFITELKTNVVLFLWVFFKLVSTSVEDLLNSETTCFSSFLIFLARSQIMCESLEKTMGRARLECLVFTFRCVLKIPNFSLYICILIYMYTYLKVYM